MSEQVAFPALGVVAEGVVLCEVADLVEEHESSNTQGRGDVFPGEGQNHGGVSFHGSGVEGGEAVWHLAECEGWVGHGDSRGYLLSGHGGGDHMDDEF